MPATGVIMAPSMTARLKALKGPLEGAEWALSEGAFTIGRENANALRLSSDAGASKRHCVIVAEDQQFTIRDLGSHNHRLSRRTCAVAHHHFDSRDNQTDVRARQHP